MVEHPPSNLQKWAKTTGPDWSHLVSYFQDRKDKDDIDHNVGTKAEKRNPALTLLHGQNSTITTGWRKGTTSPHLMVHRHELEIRANNLGQPRLQDWNWRKTDIRLLVGDTKMPRY